MKPFLVILLVFAVFSSSEGVQHGTHRIGRTTPDNYYCDTITFPTAFTGVEIVKVFTSVSFGMSSSRVHDVVFTWVEAVTTSNFKVCLVEGGIGSNGNVTVNWMAYQGIESGVTDGSIRFNDWTTGTQCQHIALSQSLATVPHVFVTAHHNVLDRKQDAATVWVEAITTHDFTVCMREARNFDGRHKNIDVTWMAMTEIPQTWNYNDFISLDFPNTAQPTEAENDAFCKVVNFHEPYHSPPTIVLTPSHLYDSSNANAVQPEHNSITAWVEETTVSHFKTCVKDLIGLDSKHHPINVQYIVFGDLDPCINKTCDYFGVCQAVSAHVSQCECISQCPSYEDLVCASNGRTFDNMCIMKREICQTQANYSYYHPGGCQEFPVDHGRYGLSHVSSFAESHCEVISLKPYTFYPDKPVHVQITVNYINATVPTTVHDATVTWSENVNKDNFTVCITKTGRNDQQTNDVASVDWLAYQGSPNGAVTGKEKITEWWTGTKCTSLSLPSGKFSGTPTVLATLEHQRDGLKHDAASVWVEDVTSSSFQVCIRELQNFDGIHQDIEVDWMAFEALHRPLFSEHGSVNFANSHTPLNNSNYAFCQDISVQQNYTRIPSVLITATHDTSVGQNNPKCNGISAWIENITTWSFRVCLKELYSDRYDPVTIQYVVISDVCGDGWTYFNGFCYKTNPSCLTWQAAQSTCLADNANLTSITSQEENTFIQHRHGGDTGWIGLQDMNKEGNFTWTDGSVVNFTYWADNQPNNYPGDQDCVHTLGLRHAYHWNDVTCGSCHAYTCKKDIDECSPGIHTCDVNARCINTIGSYTCECNPFYHGDGRLCEPAHISAQTNCGYLAINRFSGRFTSPNYPAYYRNNENCHWTLTSISNERITLSFESFDLESCCDYVRVYDGDSNAASLLGEYNGHSIPSSITSSSNLMHVTFTTNGANTDSGFSVKYGASACSSYTELSDGTRNTNFPYNYGYCDNGLSVQWYRFTGSAGTKLPTYCVPYSHCGTDGTGWLYDSHPTVQEGIVSRTACFNWYGTCCQWTNTIRVLNCGEFYVYELQPSWQTCNLRYCGTD